jgi:hypothetical protein
MVVNAQVLATEKSGQKASHEYIRDTLTFRYQKCINCQNRTNLTCIKCGYCYSCHRKEEEVERKEVKNEHAKDLSSPQRIDQYHSQDGDGHQEIEQLNQIIVDVHGRVSEPICTYYRCRHKFSLHGSSSHSCKCKHPKNKTLGVSMKYL